MTEEYKNLQRIQIEGFKSIAKLDLPMEKINILIGANGAGKTNFISLFTFLHQLSWGRLTTYVESQGFANTFFHFGSKRTSRISIDLDVGKTGYHASFLHGVNEDSLIFEEEYCKRDSTSGKQSLKGKLGESGLLSKSDSKGKKEQEDIRKYMEQCRVYHFHDTSSSAGFKQAIGINDSDYLYKDARNLAAFLYRLKSEYPAHYKEIIRTIQVVAPFFHDFYLEPRGATGEENLLLKWLHQENDNPFSANQLSDGTARFICLAVLFLQPHELQPQTIILDEPELGLHPAALHVLAELIEYAARKRQVICSTQSISFANLFGPKDFIVVDQENGVSSFKRLEEEPLEHWLEDYGMGDIWNKNLIGGRPKW